MFAMMGVFSACKKTSKQENKTVSTQERIQTVFVCEDGSIIIAQPAIEEENPIFEIVENPAEFPGGNDALQEFIVNNLVYPQEAQEKRIEGRVVVQFVVERDGSISSIVVVRGVHPLLAAEAVRVIELMPKWIPGETRGNIVRVRFTLPVYFQFSE